MNIVLETGYFELFKVTHLGYFELFKVIYFSEWHDNMGKTTILQCLPNANHENTIEK